LIAFQPPDRETVS